MKIVITGAHGFLGWHTRARLHTLTDHDVVAIGRDAEVRALTDAVRAHCEDRVFLNGTRTVVLR